MKVHGFIAIYRITGAANEPLIVARRSPGVLGDAGRSEVSSASVGRWSTDSFCRELKIKSATGKRGTEGEGTLQHGLQSRRLVSVRSDTLSRPSRIAVLQCPLYNCNGGIGTFPSAPACRAPSDKLRFTVPFSVSNCERSPLTSAIASEEAFESSRFSGWQ